MIKNIKITSRFSRKFKLLPREKRLAAVEEIKEKLAGFYSFFVLPDLRVMFRFSKPDQSEVVLYDIGPHEIYK